MRPSHFVTTFVALLILADVTHAQSDVQKRAEDILQATGVSGGFVVHLGCGDGALTGALHVNNRYYIQGLDRDAANVARARRALIADNLYGPVSVDRLSGKTLPYVDNMVNLLIAADLGGISQEEVLRVLAPRGVAYTQSNGAWTKTVKPVPEDIDDWTHYLHDPSGNAVAHDDVVGPPRHMQWLGSPRWSRHHDRMASMSALVSSNGRLVYVMDEGSRISIQTPSDWKLVCRDAFNGSILWKRPISEWHDHLWPLKSGPTQLARRLVAVGDRVYVTMELHAPLSVIDARTGETIRELENSKSTEEILVADGLVLAMVNTGAYETDEYIAGNNTGDQARVRTEFRWNEKPRRIQAYDADSGQLLWGIDAKISPLTLAANDRHIFYFNGQQVVALDRTSGSEVWKSEDAAIKKEVTMNFGPRLLVYGDVVLFAGGDRTMSSFDAATGAKLWSASHETSGYQSPEDLLVVNGLVWSWPTTSGNQSGKLTGRDPRTGEVQTEFEPTVDTYWFHHRCYIAKATDKYIMPSRTGIEFVDVARKDWEIHHWVRGGCLYGVMPANGLTYAPPHNCACYPEAKLYGFNALAARSPTRPLPAEVSDEGRLERGPAFGENPAAPPAGEEPVAEWPTYRHDRERSARSRMSLSPRLREEWEISLGGRLSPVVVADGRAFVSQVDQHTVHALDAHTGEKLWSYTAGARVDSPPTIARGRVLFGSMDGYVYCLQADDGELIWRFRAAPEDRRLMAFEQLESVWPVHGSVLVQEGTVSFVAGRSNFLDGGIRIIKLEIATGEKLSEKIIDDKDPETGENIQVRLQTLQMPAGLPDILSSDGSYVYMRSQRFDLDGNRLEIGPNSGDAAAQGAAQQGDGAHLFAPMGFLDDEWFHRSYWVYGKSFAGGHNGYYQAGRFAPSGRIICFDKDTVYGFGRKPEYYKWTTTMEHQLFAASKQPPETPEAEKNARRGKTSMVSLARPKKLDPTGQGIVVEAWVNASKPNGVILAHGGPTQGYALFLQGGKPQFIVRQKDETNAVSGKESIEGRWTHVLGQLKSDKSLELFVDGELVGSGTCPGLIDANPTQGLEVGADDQGAVGDYKAPNGFSGLIDDVRLFHGEMTAEEVAALHADHAAPTPESVELVLSWTFDDGTASDSSGNKLAGKLNDTEPVKGKFGQALSFAPPPNRQGGSFVEHDWNQDIPLLVRAMLMSGDKLVVCGPPDLIDEEDTFKRIMAGEEAVQALLKDQDDALRGKQGGIMQVVSTKDGETLSSLEVTGLPVWDGLSAAEDRVFMATTDGRVLSFVAGDQ